MEGANFSNSIIQLLRTDNGHTIRNGPHVPFALRCARKAIVCNVWMSSAKLADTSQNLPCLAPSHLPGFRSTRSRTG